MIRTLLPRAAAAAYLLAWVTGLTLMAFGLFLLTPFAPTFAYWFPSSDFLVGAGVLIFSLLLVHEVLSRRYRCMRCNSQLLLVHSDAWADRAWPALRPCILVIRGRKLKCSRCNHLN